MGENWELVSDAINSIVQFKVFFFCDKRTFCDVTCFVMSLRHAICSSFYLQDLRSTCFLVVAQCIALSMFVSVMYLYLCLFAVAKLLLFSHIFSNVSCGIIFLS
jgi:hypothetical protein